MNIELSRRQLIVGAGAGVAATTLGALGFGDVEIAYAILDPRLETRRHYRNPQHLHLLCGRLRHHHVFER